LGNGTGFFEAAGESAFPQGSLQQQTVGIRVPEDQGNRRAPDQREDELTRSLEQAVGVGEAACSHGDLQHHGSVVGLRLGFLVETIFFNGAAKVAGKGGADAFGLGSIAAGCAFVQRQNAHDFSGYRNRGGNAGKVPWQVKGFLNGVSGVFGVADDGA